MNAIRAWQFWLAVERQDCAAIAQGFADGFVLLSPASSRPFKGCTLGSGLVHAARSVLEGFRYTDLLETEHCAVRCKRAYEWGMRVHYFAEEAALGEDHRYATVYGSCEK